MIKRKAFYWNPRKTKTVTTRVNNVSRFDSWRGKENMEDIDIEVYIPYNEFIETTMKEINQIENIINICETKSFSNVTVSVYYKNDELLDENKDEKTLRS